MCYQPILPLPTLEIFSFSAFVIYISFVLTLACVFYFSGQTGSGKTFTMLGKILLTIFEKQNKNINCEVL